MMLMKKGNDERGNDDNDDNQLVKGKAKPWVVVVIPSDESNYRTPHSPTPDYSFHMIIQLYISALIHLYHFLSEVLKEEVMEIVAKDGNQRASHSPPPDCSFHMMIAMYIPSQAFISYVYSAF